MPTRVDENTVKIGAFSQAKNTPLKMLINAEIGTFEGVRGTINRKKCVKPIENFIQSI